MGLLFRRKIIEVHPHEVERKDWENVLDDVFRKTVAKMLNGIAIICNTTRQHPGDGVGIVQNELTFHIKDKRADEVRSSLRKIDLLHFENIFENYLSGSHKGLDFYRVKHILSKEIMVYPLIQQGEQMTSSAFQHISGTIDAKKGLIVFDFPIPENKTQKILTEINNIMQKPVIPSKPHH